MKPIKLLTALLLAAGCAAGLAACSNAQASPQDAERQAIEETCPGCPDDETEQNDDCPDCPDDENGQNDDCPGCPDGTEKGNDKHARSHPAPRVRPGRRRPKGSKPPKLPVRPVPNPSPEPTL